ncbi:hypothetical protein GGC65_001201 [Sphingopyxis sp. OAS728]|uniref:hypothetical protein n=1 Tax=Sphingopyxis sp. OAS728 TaxID=2663823 RepID=UPI001788FAD1|nr:hypothetical protein [Sphingopyxis sp. OAS728]MBE1526745.1 hypothetical protein [Sphingopyxis sp. OAS728]
MKYALLRHLSKSLELRIGVNWYLTTPDQVDRPGNNDGEKRHHLKGGVWRDADAELFEKIGKFDTVADRKLSNVASWEILPPDTCYFAAHVPADDRGSWHQNAIAELQPADLIFLDPDNGFEVTSMTARTRPKYSLFSEAADYVAAGKSVVAIQFARQCDPVQRAIDIRIKLVSLVGSPADFPVIRGRVAPNLLFFSIVPGANRERWRRALLDFEMNCAKAEIIE